jgi:hypothetical protein
MADLNDFRCDYCNFVCCSADSTLFFAHLVKFHSNEPNFWVYCRCCPRSFKKVNTLQKHYTRKHKNLELGQEPNLGEEGTEEFEERAAQSDLQCHAAKFLLCAKAQGKLTQSAVWIWSKTRWRIYLETIWTWDWGSQVSVFSGHGRIVFLRWCL